VKSRYMCMGAVGLLASMVFADTWATPPQSSNATADAVANAGDSNATGGHAYSAGGKGVGYGGTGGSGGNGGASESSSNSASTADGSSSNVIDASTTVERSVGALIMGTVIPVDCGFGGQAGGADRSGSGFLGLTWTTDKCYTLKAATAWAAMGEYELACEMLVDVTKKALKRRKRQPDCTIIGRDLRSAHTPEPVVIHTESLLPSTPVAPTSYVTPEQMREYVDRAFRKSVGK